MKNWDIGIS